MSGNTKNMYSRTRVASLYSDTMPSTFYCPNCTYSARQEFELRAHQETWHPAKKEMVSRSWKAPWMK
jgi:hypothetical protein